MKMFKRILLAEDWEQLRKLAEGFEEKSIRRFVRQGIENLLMKRLSNFGPPVSSGIEFQTTNPLPRIFADWFENSRELVKFAAEFLVGGRAAISNYA